MLLSLLSGGGSYLISTVKGKTKPNRVTWFLWALAPLIAFSAQLHEGVSVLGSLTTFMVGFNPALIFIASFVNKKAYFKATRLDYVCGALAILGLIGWKLSHDANLAILLAISADALAGVPTIIKSYKEPETENYKVFIGGFLSAAITLLTIKVWHFANYAFTLYILLICLLLAFLIITKIGTKKHRLSTS